MYAGYRTEGHTSDDDDDDDTREERGIRSLSIKQQNLSTKIDKECLRSEFHSWCTNIHRRWMARKDEA